MSARELALTDTVDPGTYGYCICVTHSGVGGSRRGQFTFGSAVTGQDAMHAIANQMLMEDGAPIGTVYKVQWLFLDEVTR